MSIRIDRKKVYLILASRDESTKELSEKMHITRQRLYQIFSANNVQIETLGRMARALEVDVKEIVASEV